MNVKLTKDQFLELMTVYIVEDAKSRGKDFVDEPPSGLTEYEQLIAHIAKFPMKMELKMSRYRVESKVKMNGKRLKDSLSIAEDVSLIV